MKNRPLSPQEIQLLMVIGVILFTMMCVFGVVGGKLVHDFMPH